MRFKKVSLELTRNSISSDMDCRMLFCSKVNNFGTTLAATRLIFKWLHKIAWQDPCDIEISSASSSTIIRRFDIIISFIIFTLSPETDVFGRPIRASSLVEFLSALKRLCHYKTVVRDIILSTNAFLNISNVYVAEIPFLRKTLCKCVVLLLHSFWKSPNNYKLL